MDGCNGALLKTKNMLGMNELMFSLRQKISFVLFISVQNLEKGNLIL